MEISRRLIFSADVSELTGRSIFKWVEIHADENETYRKFRNVGNKSSDAGEYSKQNIGKVIREVLSKTKTLGACAIEPLIIYPVVVSYRQIQLFKDAAQTDLFKDPIRTAQ